MVAQPLDRAVETTAVSVTLLYPLEHQGGRFVGTEMQPLTGKVGRKADGGGAGAGAGAFHSACPVLPSTQDIEPNQPLLCRGPTILKTLNARTHR